MSKWMIEAGKLDAEQSHFLNHEVTTKGNKWIKGLAGSGKSILLMYSLLDIKRKEPHASVAIIYFTHSLRQMYIVGMNELRINASNVKFMTYIEYQTNFSSKTFDYILCDEVQDLTPYVLNMMKNNCKRLLVSGDPNQSLYKKDPSTGRDVVRVDQISTVTNSSEYLLTTIHRMTDSIISLIGTLLPNLGIFKSKKSSMKKDVSVRSASFEDEGTEIEYIINNAETSISIGESAVLLFPSHSDIERFIDIYCNKFNIPKWGHDKNKWNKPDYGILNFHLNKFNAKLHYIGNNYGDLWRASKSGQVIIMTYHSAKGLDFDNVYLPFLNEETKIENETVFMVALSRSKSNLLLSHTKKMHPYLMLIADKTHSISGTNTSNKGTSGVELDLDDFDF